MELFFSIFYNKHICTIRTTDKMYYYYYYLYYFLGYFLYLGVNYDNPIEESQFTSLLDVTAKADYLSNATYKKSMYFVELFN